MGKILDYIEKTGEGKYYCYKTKKISLDGNNNDTLDYDDKPASVANSSKIAENDLSRVHTVLIPKRYIETSTPIFRYFLDGSRHVYKVDDIAIGRNIFPVLAGQIIVGCCERRSREEFKRCKLTSKLILAMPEEFDVDGENRNNNFCRLYCERINEEISKNAFFSSCGMRLDNILLYKTDGMPDSSAAGKDKHINRGTAKIQSEMMDQEQLLVYELCKENKLDDENFLIKDGSLEYNPRFSNMDISQWNLLRSNYRHVVGVSKLFDPELITDFEGHRLSKTIASLKPFERTKVYRYQSAHTGGEFAVWYLRLRNSNFRETHFSDVVKCEMVLSNEGDILQTDLINLISANIIREAYPVCLGNDTRWANHLYPIYLTETFCKSHYISNEIIYKLF